MNKKNLLIAAICGLLLALTVAAVVVFNSCSHDPVVNVPQNNTTSVEEDAGNTDDEQNNTVDTPDKGEETPDQGEETPDQDEDTPDQDEDTPDQDEDTSDQDEDTPDQDEDTSDQDEDTPDKGDETPDQGEDTPDQGEEPPVQSVELPYQIPGYGLLVEKIAPYSGTFVETGSNVKLDNVAMLLVYNSGSVAVEYAKITVQCAGQELLFEVSALPAGQRLVVQEKTGKAMPSAEATQITAMVAEREDMSMSTEKIQVLDNGDNTLTVKNLTQETIDTVRVFYKYYMKDDGIYVGGIAFTVRVTGLNAGASITLQPSHYTSKTSRVVMVLTYDSEV